VIELNDLLIALRTATESGDRGGKRKRNKHEEAASADSPSNRSQKIARSNSAAPTNELQLRSEVAFRQPKQRNSDGEWILCIVVNILGGEGNKKKWVFPEF